MEPDIGFLLGQSIHGFCEALLGKELTFQDCTWAIHPGRVTVLNQCINGPKGGKAIIELIEEKLKLTKQQTEGSWSIYEKFGNMSSATVLFVLEYLSKNGKSSSLEDKIQDNVISLAFGPGKLITQFSLLVLANIVS